MGTMSDVRGDSSGIVRHSPGACVCVREGEREEAESKVIGDL